MKHNLWPISIVGFFVLAIAGALTFVVFCNLHPTDLVTADYYEQEIRYQQEMEQVQRTLQLANKPGVTLIAGTREIEVFVPGSHLDPDLAGTVHLYRPSNAGLDRYLKLNTNARDRQTIDTQNLAPGLWRVKVAWKAGGKDYLLDEKIVVPGKES